MIGFTSALAATGLAATLAVGVPAAATGTPDPADLAQSPRAELLCGRVPLLSARTEQILTRLEGGERVRGSVARLELHIEQADGLGRDDLADHLRARLEIRRQRAAILPQQLDLLAAAQQTCEEAGR